MNDRHDVEERLKAFRHEPGSAVKDAVMVAWAAADTRAKRRLWRHPVPLYAAAAVVVLMAGLSFFAGTRVPHPRPPASTWQPADSSHPADGVLTSQDIEWSIAERDLL